MELRGDGVRTTLWFGPQPSPREWRNPSGVVVVPRLEDGRFVLVEHRKRLGWEFPGGKIEPGESWPAACRREVMEEAGATIDDLSPLCKYTLRKDASVCHGVACTCRVVSLGRRTDIDEIADVGAFDSLPEAISYKDGFVQFVFELLGPKAKPAANRPCPTENCSEGEHA